MKKMYAVIGSGFGDEAKGVFTNHLSKNKNYNDNYIIRFNGGAQAGHTVVENNCRHVFGHFGANSLLNNSNTVLSEFFVLNPFLYFKERDSLINKKIKIPKVFVNENCYITTFFDMLINQFLEKSRNTEKHGSCGVGFGQTIERNEIENISFKYVDLNLSEKEIFYKMKLVQNYFFNYLEKNNLIQFLTKEHNFLYSNEFIENQINTFLNFKLDTLSYKKEKDIIDLNNNNLVFEGAQGLMLDQDYGSFPHVTRSNTGLKNIVNIINKNNWNDIKLETYYATRSYTTRHGAGPLKNELKNKPYNNIIDNTNINNEYQGPLRFSYLDLNVLKNAIDFDGKYSHNINFEKRLAISCLDQSKKFNYYLNNELNYINDKFFAKKIAKELNINEYIESFSETGPN